MIDPIKGYYLEKAINSTTFLQIVTTIYVLIKTIVTKQSAIIYHGRPINIYLYLVVVLIQCGISLYLLSTQDKNPKRWKSWVLLMVTLFVGSANIEKHRFGIGMDLVGILLVISCIYLIVTTHSYLKKTLKK
jgi:hypothetical protein